MYLLLLFIYKKNLILFEESFNVFFKGFFETQFFSKFLLNFNKKGLVDLIDQTNGKLIKFFVIIFGNHLKPNRLSLLFKLLQKHVVFNQTANLLLRENWVHYDADFQR